MILLYFQNSFNIKIRERILTAAVQDQILSPFECNLPEYNPSPWNERNIVCIANFLSDAAKGIKEFRHAQNCANI